MRVFVVLLLAAFVSGCGGGGDERGVGDGLAIVVDGQFWVRFDDGRPARQLDVQSPAGVGHWSWAEISPDGSTFLAQWIAECEVPVAYFVAARGGEPRPVIAAGIESIALRWTPGGAAEVALPKGICGGSGGRPGVYAVEPDGRRRFVRRIDPATDRVHW